MDSNLFAIAFTDSETVACSLISTCGDELLRWPFRAANGPRCVDCDKGSSKTWGRASSVRGK